MGMDEAGARGAARSVAGPMSYTLVRRHRLGRDVAIPTLGFDNYIRQLDDVLERAGLTQAAFCGVSFGGFIALRYAATPSRTRLGARPRVVAGARLDADPSSSAATSRGPGGRRRRFVATSPLRVWPEMRAALPHVGRGWRSLARQAAARAWRRR